MLEIHKRFVAEVRKGRSTDVAARAVGATPGQGAEWLQNPVIQDAVQAPELKPAKVSKPRTVRRRTATKRKK